MNEYTERLFLVDIETLKRSKKSWKTYKGALQNASSIDMIVTSEGYAWMLRYPDYCKYRLTL